eukprot:Nitzschia sp. Nitz4//scaffold2_size372955//98191//100256//NITZ4_000389-RA/size372955-processed-gene-0.486-mRNA-1//-1//CDS//3329546674//6235//frame0
MNLPFLPPLWFGCAFLTLNFMCLAQAFFLFPLVPMNSNEPTLLQPGIFQGKHDTYAGQHMRSTYRHNSKTTCAMASPHFFEPEQIQEIQQQVDILDVIETCDLPKFQRIPNNRAICLCPFHDDRNPSLRIDGARQIFKCFSCGVGGNVFQFVQQYAKVNGYQWSFPYAVNFVKTKFVDSFNGTSPIRESRPWSPSSQPSDRSDPKLYRTRIAHLAAASYYRSCLTTWVSAGPARSYLRERRLSPATVKEFIVGYAPDTYFAHDRKAPTEHYVAWGAGSLVEHLQEEGFTPDEIVQSGLAIVRNPKNQLDIDLTTTTGNILSRPPNNTTKHEDLSYDSLMDRFRGRLVVPILDKTGSYVLGFGGRLIPKRSGESESDKNSTVYFEPPKYINSPESALFQKRETLFGHHMAARAIQARNASGGEPTPLFLVEGYMDTVALWQAGVKECVSSMGTSLTSEQVNGAADLAREANKQVVICFDNDAAGRTGVARLCVSGILMQTSKSLGVNFLVGSLPDGCKDAAEFVETSNCSTPSEIGELFRQQMQATSLPWDDWHMTYVLSQYTNSSFSLQDRERLLEDLADFLRPFPGKRRRELVRRAVPQLVQIASRANAYIKASTMLEIRLGSDILRRAGRSTEKRFGRRFTDQKSNRYGEATPYRQGGRWRQ